MIIDLMIVVGFSILVLCLLIAGTYAVVVMAKDAIREFQAGLFGEALVSCIASALIFGVLLLFVGVSVKDLTGT